jgi:hypothetical protein
MATIAVHTTTITQATAFYRVATRWGGAFLLCACGCGRISDAWSALAAKAMNIAVIRFFICSLTWK